jgi:hypothetical protein
MNYSWKLFNINEKIQIIFYFRITSIYVVILNFSGANSTGTNPSALQIFVMLLF